MQSTDRTYTPTAERVAFLSALIDTYGFAPELTREEGLQELVDMDGEMLKPSGGNNIFPNGMD